MMDETLDAILSNDDLSLDTCLLVAADWLEEQGDSANAGWLRERVRCPWEWVQVALEHETHCLTTSDDLHDSATDWQGSVKKTQGAWYGWWQSAGSVLGAETLEAAKARVEECALSVHPYYSRALATVPERLRLRLKETTSCLA